MDHNFADEENLYRAVKPYAWLVEENRIKSSLFKDSNGVSVDRDGERGYVEIFETMERKFGTDLVALAYVDVKFCKELPTTLYYKPEPDNPFHSEIHDTERAMLSEGKAKRLAKKAVLIFSSITPA